VFHLLQHKYLSFKIYVFGKVNHLIPNAIINSSKAKAYMEAAQSLAFSKHRQKKTCVFLLMLSLKHTVSFKLSVDDLSDVGLT